MKPLVSILIPTYNASFFISDAIESVLESNYSNWEMIIVDDCSSDNSHDIAIEYAQHDNRIKVFKNNTNLGDYPNRNETAKHAKGVYLKYLDNDDILYKYSLDYMVEAMEQFSDAAFATAHIIVDDSKPYPICCSPKEIYHAEFLNKSYLGYGPSSAIIRRSCFEKANGFSGKPFLGDHELWLKLSLKYCMIKLQPALIWYRIHENQESKNENMEIKNKLVRYKHTRNALENGKYFFSDKELIFAIKKMKRNYARFILKYLISQREIKSFWFLYSKSDLSFWELLQGFKSYL